MNEGMGTYYDRWLRKEEEIDNRVHMWEEIHEGVDAWIFFYSCGQGDGTQVSS